MAHIWVDTFSSEGEKEQNIFSLATRQNPRAACYIIP